MRTKDPKSFLTVMAILFVILLSALPSLADVIIDNGGTGTSYTGDWLLSGGTSPYGSSSLWSRNGATYTFSMSGQPAGIYEVLMWWSGLSSRASSVPVTISYSGGTGNLTVNQSQNTGRWNSLGSFHFDGSGSVTITAANGDSLSTCADAVQFRFSSSNVSPTATIDSITPSPASPGANITFTGHGTDSDGTITAYEWTSSINGTIGSTASFSTATLSAGTHAISFKVRDSSNAWSSAVTRELTVGAASTEVIIDNTSSLTSRTGSWAASSAPNHYGTGSVWGRDGATFTWSFTPSQSGSYDVSMWWTTTSSRSSAIPVAINHGSGSSMVTINQLQNAGQWNTLGRFSFVAGTTYNIRITAPAAPTSTCADAVKFTLAATGPTAVIDSITPSSASLGQSITFTGHGTGSTITAYEWTSSINGVIGSAASFSTSALGVGTHTISFRVKDSQGVISNAATSTLIVGSSAPSGNIIDNNDTRTSRTGTWTASSATGSYGTGSVWSRDGATFTWKYTPTATGYYDVSMWWTTTASRSHVIPVTINHSAGSRIVYIDQLQDAGQWNSLGSYNFIQGRTYDITITAPDAPTSTCADAVRFLSSTSTSPVADFSADEVTGSAPFDVQFTDRSTGVVTSWLWNFGDGTTSTQRNPSHTYSSSGYYTVSLTVSGSSGSNTKIASQYIHVTPSTAEHIYIADGYASDATFMTNVKIVLRSLNATDAGDTWYYTNGSTGKQYVIHFLNTTAAFMSALKQPNAHIIFNGHSNFGLGGSFAYGNEAYVQRIEDIYYIDDDRFTHVSTPMVSVNIRSLQTHQAYPNWRPVFKDGRNGVMPHTFSEGTPPYNYYLTYKVPGDSTLYRTQLANGTYLQRFPDSGVPAWFSPIGAAPDPSTNRQYFIVNNSTSTDPNKPHFGNKTIVYGNTGIDASELKYSRMFYAACNSCNYFGGTFHRGIMFCTTSDSEMYTADNYLKDYLTGMSDSAILQHLNSIQNIHEMINFNLKPPSLR